MTTAALFQEPAIAPAADPDGPTPDAPYGWTTGADGVRRPKKTAGRRPKSSVPEPGGISPSLDELRAQGPRQVQEDTAPSTPPKGKAAKAPKVAKEPPADLPPFRAGPIAKAVNKLYRRAGKILKVWDPMLGAAVVSTTIKKVDDDGDENTTVGEAWEEIARLNPRIRALLLKLLETSAWGALAMAHAPIILAILMKESVLKRIPFGRLIQAFLDNDDEDQGDEDPAGVAAMMGGLNPGDLAGMLSMIQATMPAMFADMPRGMNETRGEEAA